MAASHPYIQINFKLQGKVLIERDVKEIGIMSNLLKGIFGDAASKDVLGNIDRQYAMYPLQNPYLADIRMQLGAGGAAAGPGYYYPAGV